MYSQAKRERRGKGNAAAAQGLKSAIVRNPTVEKGPGKENVRRGTVANTSSCKFPGGAAGQFQVLGARESRARLRERPRKASRRPGETGKGRAKPPMAFGNPGKDLGRPWEGPGKSLGGAVNGLGGPQKGSINLMTGSLCRPAEKGSGNGRERPKSNDFLSFLKVFLPSGNIGPGKGPGKGSRERSPFPAQGPRARTT